jgi:hypothetical protein
MVCPARLSELLRLPPAVGCRWALVRGAHRRCLAFGDSAKEARRPVAEDRWDEIARARPMDACLAGRPVDLGSCLVRDESGIFVPVPERPTVWVHPGAWTLAPENCRRRVAWTPEPRVAPRQVVESVDGSPSWQSPVQPTLPVWPLQGSPQACWIRPPGVVPLRPEQGSTTQRRERFLAGPPVAIPTPMKPGSPAGEPPVERAERSAPRPDVLA